MECYAYNIMHPQVFSELAHSLSLSVPSLSLALSLSIDLSEPLWSPQKALHVSCVRLSNIVSIIIITDYQVVI